MYVKDNILNTHTVTYVVQIDMKKNGLNILHLKTLLAKSFNCEEPTEMHW